MNLGHANEPRSTAEQDYELTSQPMMSEEQENRFEEALKAYSGVAISREVFIKYESAQETDQDYSLPPLVDYVKAQHAIDVLVSMGASGQPLSKQTFYKMFPSTFLVEGTLNREIVAKAGLMPPNEKQQQWLFNTIENAKEEKFKIQPSFPAAYYDVNNLGKTASAATHTNLTNAIKAKGLGVELRTNFDLLSSRELAKYSAHIFNIDGIKFKEPRSAKERETADQLLHLVKELREEYELLPIKIISSDLSQHGELPEVLRTLNDPPNKELKESAKDWSWPEETPVDDDDALVIRRKDAQLSPAIVDLSKSANFPQLAKSFSDDSKILLGQNLPMFITEMFNYFNFDPVTMSCPGHQGGEAIPLDPIGRAYLVALGYDPDATNVSTLFFQDVCNSMDKYFSQPLEFEGWMKHAQAQATKLYNTDKVAFCTGGSSASNFLALKVRLKAGDIVLVDRNCHHSVTEMLKEMGVHAISVDGEITAGGTMAPPSLDQFNPEKIQQKIKDYWEKWGLDGEPPTKVRQAILTSRTYDGVQVNIEMLDKALAPIAETVHYDFAWANPTMFSKRYDPAFRPNRPDWKPSLPTSFCTSNHKNGVGLSQTSMVHFIESDPKKPTITDQLVTRYQSLTSTSPLYHLFYSAIHATLRAKDPWGDRDVKRVWKQSLKVRRWLEKKNKENPNFIFKAFGPEIGNKTDEEILEQGTKYFALTNENRELHGIKSNIPKNYLQLDIGSLLVDTRGMVDKVTGELAKPGEIICPAPVAVNKLEAVEIVQEKTNFFQFKGMMTPGTTDRHTDRFIRSMDDFQTAYEQGHALKTVLPDIAKHPVYQQALGENPTLRNLADYVGKVYRELNVIEICNAVNAAVPEAMMPLPVAGGLESHVDKPNIAIKVAIDQIKVGDVALQQINPYPPGKPAVWSGEGMSEELVRYFKLLVKMNQLLPGMGLHVHGAVPHENGGFAAYIIHPTELARYLKDVEKRITRKQEISTPLLQSRIEGSHDPQVIAEFKAACRQYPNLKIVQYDVETWKNVTAKMPDTERPSLEDYINARDAVAEIINVHVRNEDVPGLGFQLPKEDIAPYIAKIPTCFLNGNPPTINTDKLAKANLLLGPFKALFNEATLTTDLSRVLKGKGNVGAPIGGSASAIQKPIALPAPFSIPKKFVLPEPQPVRGHKKTSSTASVVHSERRASVSSAPGDAVQCRPYKEVERPSNEFLQTVAAKMGRKVNDLVILPEPQEGIRVEPKNIAGMTDDNTLFMHVGEGRLLPLTRGRLPFPDGDLDKKRVQANDIKKRNEIGTFETPGVGAQERSGVERQSTTVPLVKQQSTGRKRI